MRKLLIGAAIAASALTAAAPAAAQYYPGQQQQYGYGQNNWGQTRALAARIDQIRQQIRVEARRGMLSGQDAYRLDIQAQQLRAQLRQSAYGGIDQRERYQLERQIQRLEQRVSYNNSNRYGRGTGFGGNGYYGQNQVQNQDGRYQDRDGDWHDRDRRERDDNND
jgi:opacity protein-like surface antigen